MLFAAMAVHLCQVCDGIGSIRALFDVFIGFLITFHMYHTVMGPISWYAVAALKNLLEVGPISWRPKTLTR